MKTGFTLSIFVALMLLMACAQTSSTQSQSAPQPQSEEAPKSSGQESAEAPQSEQQQSRQTSESSGQDSAEASRSKSQETGQSSESATEKSAEAAQSEKQKTQSNSKSGENATMDNAAGQPQASRSSISPESEPATDRQSTDRSADGKLAEARENLRLSRETEQQIAGELEELKKSGSASEDAVKDYETYLKSVQAMTAENRKIVEQMEAAYAKKSSGKDGSGLSPANSGGSQSEFEIPEAGTVDEVAALDRQLDSSLAKFDGLLLKEMEEIQAGSSKRLRDLAEEAAEAAKRLREQGYEGGTGSTQSSGETQSGESAESQAGSDGKRTGGETAANDQSRKGGEGSSGQDQRRVSYDDDDIVARQLREAAENETDPELKKKLWKEYEEYKKSR